MDAQLLNHGDLWQGHGIPTAAFLAQNVTATL